LPTQICYLCDTFISAIPDPGEVSGTTHSMEL
jgi:hypothetical protein